eukprot:4763549-Pyramimonas_sp.AAC.1
MSEMRLLGVDVTDRKTPPWGWHSDASPSADQPDRLSCLPGFAAHPTCLPFQGPSTADGSAAVFRALSSDQWKANWPRTMWRGESL